MQGKSTKTLVDVGSGLRFAKCPVWIHQRLFFLDIHDRSIKSTDMNGSIKTEKVLPYLPGAFGALPGKGLFIGDARRQNIFILENESQVLAADLSRIANSCLSDAIVATKSGIYVGDVGFDFLDPLVDPVSNGAIVYIDNRGRPTLVAKGLFFPNGLVITPNERTLIVAETLGHNLTAFDIAKDGSLVNRRDWAKLPDDVNPDGICLDEEGAIWAATATPRAVRIVEGGEIIDEITTKRPVVAVTLGGTQGRHLFMCTSASSDPVITRQAPSVTIEFALVNASGATESTEQLSERRSISQ